MIDTTWIRTYGGKNFYCDQTIRAHRGFQAEDFDDGGSQFRAVYGNYGVMFRNDGSAAYLLITNNGDPYGQWRSTWPFTMDLASGSISMSAGQQLKGGTYIYSSAGNKRLLFNSNNNFIPTAADGRKSPGTVDLGSSENYFGTVNATAFTKRSDRRDKEELGDLTEEEAIAVLHDFSAKKFVYKNDEMQVVQYGAYAQDIRDSLIMRGIGHLGLISIATKETEKSVKDLGYPEEQVSYGLDYTQLIPPLIVGWQSHDAMLEKLERRDTELQEEINRVYIEIARIKDELGAA